MAGLANDYLIYPILDLIRKELRKQNIGIDVLADPFEGEPSVELWRDFARDPDRVSGAGMVYESGYRIEYYMTFGTEDRETIPRGIGPEHPEWDYYWYERMTSVTIVTLNPRFEPLVTYLISLNYDERGLLTGTSASRI